MRASKKKSRIKEYVKEDVEWSFHGNNEPPKKLSDMKGILKISKKETKKIIDKLRKEWD